MTNYILTPGETILRLLISAVLGSVIGWDRERKEGTAGLRTHMLVSVGSTLIMLVSTFGFEDILGHPSVVLDPSRIAAQVISGIGFLGAGAIIFLRQQMVRGLTTAAGLWSVAAVGLAVGSGLYLAALFATAIIFIIIAVMKPLEKWIFRNGKGHDVSLSLDIKKTNIIETESIIRNNGLEISETSLHSNNDSSYNMKVTFESKSDRGKLLLIIEQLNNMPEVSKINMES